MIDGLGAGDPVVPVSSGAMPVLVVVREDLDEQRGSPGGRCPGWDGRRGPACPPPHTHRSSADRCRGHLTCQPE